MDSKTELITLVTKKDQREQEFEIEHAERILNLPDGGGWELTKDSQYKYSVENGIGKRDIKKSDPGTGKAGDYSKSNSASKPN